MKNFRWVLAVLMFLITFISYMDRVNLSVATPEIMKEFNFTKMDIGFFQTVFFMGYSAMQVPGGILAEYFRHRIVVVGAVAWWSVFTALTAFAGTFSQWVMVRAAFGLGEGPVYPALSTFIARWFNPAEKGKASSLMLSGAFVGPVLGPAATVALMLAFGWRSVFVIFGLVGLVIAVAWLIFAKNSPKESPYVSAAELKYIDEGRDAAVEDKKELAPWKSFIASPQFWAIGIQYFIVDYIMYVYLAWLPLYLMEAQKFSLTKMGIAASFPWAALCLVTLTTGALSDKLVAAGASKAKARSWLAIVGLVFCSLFLYLGAIATEPVMNVAWLTLSLGSLGLSFPASWSACMDLGGKFSGSVSGWMNFWGNIGGCIAPLLTAWIATNYGWQAAIIVTALSAIIGILAWLLVKPDIPLQRSEVKPQTLAAKS
ncbi:MAG TPA: MFS transporter [Patescibacteria group bacterium]|nr:MFS transporter [Patescibacteria group bacterium]